MNKMTWRMFTVKERREVPGMMRKVIIALVMMVLLMGASAGVAMADWGFEITCDDPSSIV